MNPGVAYTWNERSEPNKSPDDSSKKTASMCSLLLIGFSTHFYLMFILKTSPDNIGQKYIEPFKPFLFETHTAFLGLYVDGASL